MEINVNESYKNEHYIYHMRQLYYSVIFTQWTPSEHTTEMSTLQSSLPAALLTKLSYGNNPRCPSTEEWIKEVCRHNGIVLSL